MKYLSGNFRNVIIRPKPENGTGESAKKPSAIHLDVMSFLGEINYHISNERYSDETLRFLEGHHGIDKYVGICGGGNQLGIIFPFQVYK